MSQPSREKIKKFVAKQSDDPQAGPSESFIAKAAAKEGDRQQKLQSVKKLLKFEVINDATLRLLKSRAYQAFISEKILFRLTSSTAENIASSYNKIFLGVQFSKRFIAFLYWGDDNR